MNEEDEILREEGLVERTALFDFYCDICSREGMRLVPAVYDAKTKYAYWAYMCELCFQKYGIGLGLGKGQKLKKENAP